MWKMLTILAKAHGLTSDNPTRLKSGMSCQLISPIKC